MGAIPVRVPPGHHDRQVGILSHLPHAMAAVLVNLGESLERADVSGGSWRDLTRVGGVDPDLWTQILLGNRRELSTLLADAEAQLAELRGAIEANDAVAVRAYLERARIAKRKQEA
ncbi:MAG: prephenate dehydrogenase dimerization domain-containing protein [Fimbriimonas sp.]